MRASSTAEENSAAISKLKVIFYAFSTKENFFASFFAEMIS